MGGGAVVSRKTPEGWHGMLFKGELVRATIEGRKTETRRVVTHANSTVNGHGVSRRQWDAMDFDWSRAWVDPGLGAGPYLKAPTRGPEYDDAVYRIRPRIESGHHVWVRETWGELRYEGPDEGYEPYWWRADYTPEDELMCATPEWKPSIHMPFRASRLALHVWETVPERVQMVDEVDARAEGLRGIHPRTSLEEFVELWDAINGKRSEAYTWEANPWVWTHRYTLLDGTPQEVANRGE